MKNVKIKYTNGNKSKKNQDKELFFEIKLLKNEIQNKFAQN